MAQPIPGIPTDSEASADKPTQDSIPEQMLNGLLYGISLPERLVRSAVGLTAGTAREIAEFVVPQAFQDSKTYEVAIRNSLDFLLDNVGAVSGGESSTTSVPNSGAHADNSASGESSSRSEQVATVTAGDQSARDQANANPGRFIARKAVGNFIDIAGLATLHVSPLWILAIVSDAAYGTKTYVHELASELQKQGLIDDSSTIHKVDDLFHAVKNASGKAASSFEQPPLSLEELRSSIEQTREALNEVDPRSLIPESEIGRFWSEMKALAKKEDVSLLGVSGAVAMQAVESIRDVSHGTLTGLFVAGKIVNRNIFGHYASALTQIHRDGIWSSVKGTYGPYIGMAWGNFTSARKTWTEQVLHPSTFAKIWSRICGLFSRRSPT